MDKKTEKRKLDTSLQKPFKIQKNMYQTKICPASDVFKTAKICF